MSLKHYRVDLRSLSDSENSRVYDLLNGIAEIGLLMTQTPRVHECFIDERVSIKEIPGLPDGLLREIP